MGRQPALKQDNHEKVRAVIDAVREFDLSESAAWSDLDVLSTQTTVDGIEVDPEGVIIENGNRFRGIANVYVALRYGSGPDSFETSDGFLGTFRGHLEKDGVPVIEEFTVDTAPFFAGEELP
jgi:hypothetical protein